MQRKRVPMGASPGAWQIVFGEQGRAALVMILLAAGAGMLLDFQFTGLHPVFSVGVLVISVPVGLYWIAHRTLRMTRKQEPPEIIRNLALAAAASQAGCSSVVLVFLALFGGLYLDSRLDTHPIFTLILVFLSVPIGLYAMVRMVLSTTARITPTPSAGKTQDSFSSAAQASHKKENGS